MTRLHSESRRRWLKLVTAAAASATMPTLRAEARPVVVLTAYPDEVIGRYRAAFETRHPEYRLQVLWRMPKDALSMLEQPDRGGVDVFWAASPPVFARLDAGGAWRPLAVDHTVLPATLGGIRLAGPEDHYVATETAGYGFAINRPALDALGVEPPRDWNDLTNPRLAGRIALPNPAAVGFAAVMIDIVLRAYGWAQGWALWSEIAGNAKLMDRGATFVSDEVAAGRCALGLSIDFFVASAIANGAKLAFAYPAHGGLNPGQIAITRSSANPAGAQAFVDFVLSREGQRLLLLPDVRKLPIRPEVYADAPAGYHNPFAAAATGAYAYTGDPKGGRPGLVGGLFAAALCSRHEARVAAWARLRRAEAAGIDTVAIRALLAAAPAPEHVAGDEALLASFRTGGHPPPVEEVPVLRACRQEADARLHEAEGQLAKAGV